MNLRVYETMEYKKPYKVKKGSAKRNYAEKTESQNYGKESVDSEVRKCVNPIKPLMTEEENGRNHGSTEPRTFGGALKPLMSEAEKSEAQVLDLSYDFACRIIRLYKYLNEGKLNKADRDIVEIGRAHV